MCMFVCMCVSAEMLIPLYQMCFYIYMCVCVSVFGCVCVCVYVCVSSRAFRPFIKRSKRCFRFFLRFLQCAKTTNLMGSQIKETWRIIKNVGVPLFRYILAPPRFKLPNDIIVATTWARLKRSVALTVNCSRWVRVSENAGQRRRREREREGEWYREIDEYVVGESRHV